MAIYKSEYEKFLAEKRESHPDWADSQRDGLHLLWNKKVDFGEQKRWREAREAQKSYPYDVNF